MISFDFSDCARYVWKIVCYQIKQNLNGFKSMQYQSYANTSYLHQISSADGFWQKNAFGKF